MAKESSLKQSVLRFLAANFPAAVVRKRHGTVFATAGDPDIYFVLGGRHFEVELKVPGQSPTPLQMHRLAQWSAAGAIAACIHSTGELQALLAHHGYPVPAPGPPLHSRSI